MAAARHVDVLAGARRRRHTAVSVIGVNAERQPSSVVGGPVDAGGRRGLCGGLLVGGECALSVERTPAAKRRHHVLQARHPAHVGGRAEQERRLLAPPDQQPQQQQQQQQQQRRRLARLRQLAEHAASPNWRHVLWSHHQRRQQQQQQPNTTTPAAA